MLKKLLSFLKSCRKDQEIGGKKVVVTILDKDTDPFNLFFEKEYPEYRIANVKELNVFLNKYKPKKNVYSVDYYNLDNKFEKKAFANRIRNGVIENFTINPIKGLFKGTEILLIEK